MKKINLYSAFAKRSVIISWIFSYMLLLLLPLTITFAGFRNISKIMETEIMHTNEFVLKTVLKEVDLKISSAKDAFSFIFNEKNFTNMRRHVGYNNTFRTEGAAFFRSLNTYSISDYSGEITIYWPDMDYIMTTSTFNRSFYLYTARGMEGLNDESYEEWINLLSGDYNNEYMIASFPNMKNTGNNLAFAHSIKLNKHNRSNIFISIPFSSIEKLTSSLNDSRLLLINPDGSVAAAFGENAKWSPPAHVEIPMGGGSSSISINNDRYMCTFTQSDYGWQFAIITPDNVFWESYIKTRVFIFGSVILSLVLGLLLTVLLLRNNYRPVRSVLSFIGKQHKGNEFESIRSAYSRLSDENDSMNKKLINRDKKLLESYLLSLMKGRRKWVESPEMDSLIGMDFYEGNIFLAAVTPAEPVNFNDIDDKNLNCDETVFFAIDNVFTELFENVCKFYRVDDGLIIFYILRFDNDKSDINDLFNEKLNFMSELFENKLKTPIHAILSRTTDDLNNINLLYRDVMDALTYQTNIGSKGYIHTEDILLADEALTYTRKLRNQELYDAVIKGDVESVKACAENILSICVKNSAVSSGLLKLTLSESCSFIYEAYINVITDSAKRQKLSNMINQLLMEQNTDDIPDIFLKIALWAGGELSNHNKDKTSSLTKRIQDYINKNYTNLNLNIQNIAFEVNLTPSYTSRIFREETGESLLEYINNVRIKAAINIMAGDVKIPQEQIAEMVGYANVRTYRRAFSRAEGITPGRYVKR